MLKFLFYFMGVIAILYEFWALYNYDAIKRLKEKYKKEDKEKMTTLAAIFAILMMGYMAWSFIGLFGSQWFLFLLLIVLSLIGMAIKNRVWSFIDSWLSIGLIMFAILNTYHFHIDTFNLFLSYFK